jgi:hypothetical protein
MEKEYVGPAESSGIVTMWQRCWTTSVQIFRSDAFSGFGHVKFESTVFITKLSKDAPLIAL